MRNGAPRYEETGGGPAALVSRLCSLPVPFPAVAGVGRRLAREVFDCGDLEYFSPRVSVVLIILSGF